jgi:hypothetical protein
MKNQSRPNSLTRFIQASIPWSTKDTIENIEDLNPKYKDFYQLGTKRDDAIARHSVSIPTSPENVGVGSMTQIDKNYNSYMYANVDTDKLKRLLDYRMMAAYAEVGDALDEICDDVLYEDENSRYVNIVYRDDVGVDLDGSIEAEIEKEFTRVVRYFDFEIRGWEYFRNLMIDGEVFFENIIHEDHKDLGILGVNIMPTELLDPIYDNVQNMVVKGYLLRRPVYDPKTNSVEKIEFIPFDRNQITYVHSGIWNEDKSLRVPFIENARRAYRQLTLIEDAIVIYRLVRAPERLVFNVDVGNMPAPKAEAYLKKLMQDYWSRKTYDHNKGGATNAFNPQSMLDSFWFAKRQGSEGSSVTSLPGGANLGELTDLMYFLTKLYRSLKVPSNRLNPESRYEDSAQVLREELKFAKFLIRLQQKFAAGIKNTFITHLKMKGLWEEYDLKENYFNVKFNPPSQFYELREQQIQELKFANFSQMSTHPKISDSISQKKYLKWSDKEIAENRSWLRKDAAFTFEIAQIEAMGPNWREQMEAQADAITGGAPPGGGGMPGPAGSALPPFGGEADVPPEAGGSPPDPAQVSDIETSLPGSA